MKISLQDSLCLAAAGVAAAGTARGAEVDASVDEWIGRLRSADPGVNTAACQCAPELGTPAVKPLADVTVVARGMGLDHRIGPHFLQAGIGYGGSCFPKDVSALKQLAGNSGYHFQLLNAVIEVNELQKRKVIGKLKRYLGDELRGKRIALLGLAFKPNTDDIRQASSIVLAGRLIAEGAQVVGYDPVAMENMQSLVPALCCMPSALSALEDADACVLVTEWEEFLGLDWAAVKELMSRPIVIDGRNALDGASLAAMGFIYEGVGTK